MTVPVRDAAAATRESVVCELFEVARSVTLRSDPRPDRVCDVFYQKPDEDEPDSVPWSARNDPEYCTLHYRDLVERLASSGWTCTASDGAAMTDGTETAERTPTSDETAVVVPSETTPADEITAPDGAASDAVAADTDEADESARDRFGNWCVPAMNGPERTAGSAETYCACVLEGPTARELSAGSLDRMPEALPISGSGGPERAASAAPNRSTYLDALAVIYETTAESCR